MNIKKVIKPILGICFVFIFCLNSCTDSTQKDNSQKQDFFNLKEYVEQEIETLSNKTCSIYKVGHINEESSQGATPTDEVNWGKEFKILSDMDINKSAWKEHFDIDTLEVLSEDFGKVYEISYSTQSDKIPIKKLTITYPIDSFEQPVFLEVERKTQSWIFNSYQKIYYNPQVALHAEGSLKALWLKERTFSITSILKCYNEYD